eukprot:PhM_4_TR16761/c1_g6_i1/m.75176
MRSSTQKAYSFKKTNDQKKKANRLQKSDDEHDVHFLSAHSSTSCPQGASEETSPSSSPDIPSINAHSDCASSTWFTHTHTNTSVASTGAVVAADRGRCRTY